MAKKENDTKVEYKTITFDFMREYIETNAPEEKAWFKSIAIVDGKYNHLKAKKEFCEKYMPDIIPIAKPKQPNKSAILESW